MIRLLISCLLALAVTACATVPPPVPVSAAASTKSAGVATIAQFGTWEWELAPSITRVQVLANRATAQIKEGRLSKETATTVLATLEGARDALKAARRGENEEPTPENRAALSEAKRLLGIAAALLE